MSSIFQPKRVPGLLTDDEMALGVKEYAAQQKATTQYAPPNTSALEFADKTIGNAAADLRRSTRAAPGMAPVLTGVEQAGSERMRVAPDNPNLGLLGEIGTLAPGGDEQTREHDILLRNATQQVQTALEDQKFREQAASQWGPPIETDDPAERAWQQEQLAKGAAERQKPVEGAVKTLGEVAATPPTQTWWRNAFDVGVRSAAQVGVSVATAPVDAWELSLGRIMSEGDIKQSPAGAWLDSVDKSLTQMLPGDPARSKEFVSELAAGTGSMAAFLLAGYVGSVMGAPAAVVTSVTGGFSGANQLYEEAERFNAHGLAKYLAFFGGGMIGLSEGLPLDGALRRAIPLDRAFFSANSATGGMLLRMLNNTAASSVEEFIQEFAQSAGEDIVAKYLYDPNRELDVIDWARAGVVGGTVGGGVGTVTSVLGETGALGAEPAAAVKPEQQQKVAETVYAQGQAQLDAILGRNAETSPGTEGAALDGEPAAGAGAAAAPEGGAVTTQEAEEPGARLSYDPIENIIVRSGPRGAETKTDTSALTELVRTTETGLDPESEAARAISDFIGHEVDTQIEHGIMNATRLERIARGENPQGLAELETAFAPVREAIRAQFGDTIKLFRMQREIAPNERGAIRGSAPQDGKRATLSWTTDQKFARDYAGVTKDLPVVSEAQIAAYEAEFEANGRVKIGRNWLVRDWQDGRGDSKYPGIFPDRGGEPAFDDMVTDTDSVRSYIESDNEWATERSARNDLKEAQVISADVPVDDILWVSDRAGQSEFIVRNDAEREVFVDETGKLRPPTPKAVPADPQIVAAVQSVQLEPSETLPLPALEKGLTGPIPSVVAAARAYADAVGMPHRRARSYVKVDTSRAARIAQAYADMKHEPGDPAVQAAYKAIAEETIAQYQFVKATGIKIETIQEGQPDPYPNGPRDVLKDIAAGHIWYFPTDQGFGSSDFDASDNPLLDATQEVSDNGVPMVVNDLFRVVHDFFGHGLEGSGFGARGEENAWQSHMRLFSASAVPAMTSETRGQNSWVNYGPFGEANRANPRNTTYADQKTGLMPSWTWQEGVEDSHAYALDGPVQGADAATFLAAISDAKAASPFGAKVHVYSAAEYGKMKRFLSPDGLSGFALKGADIVSVFAHPLAGGGRLRKIMDTAITNGGKTLDAFDGKLVQLYAAYGFREVRRENWSDEFKPEGWLAEWGKPDVVFMEYAPEVDSLVAAPLFGAGRLAPEGTGPGGRVRVRDVAQALQDRHMATEGRKLFPETSSADFERVLTMASADFEAQLDSLNSGVGWYSTDVANAVELTARVFPTLLTNDTHRELYLTFAGIFSNGLDPDQAWQLSSEAFGSFVETGVIPVDRPGGKKWGVRSPANSQQLEFLNWLIEREGGIGAAMAWMKGQQKRTDINKAMTESGIYKAGRFTTKATQEGETFGFLVFGEKLGRYTLGLHGVPLEADNTTVDLWYTRTFRRWTGRLFDTPISSEGIAGGVANDAEREAVFRITGELQQRHPQLTAGDVQAVLWFFEKRLYAEHGVRTNEGTNSSGARKLLSARGLNAGEGSTAASGEGGQTGESFAALVDPAIDYMAGTSITRNSYALEPTRPAAGIPEAPDTEPEDATLAGISKNLTDLLDLTVRQKLRQKDKGVMGEYHRNSTVIRLRSWNDLSTLAHEAGHAFNDVMHLDPQLDAFIAANDSRLRKIAMKLYQGDLSNAPAETRRREGFAEFFRVYTLTPQYAEKHWPQLTADFRAAMKVYDPRLLDGLGAISTQFEAWLHMPSTDLMRGMVLSGYRDTGIGAAIKELREAGVTTWMQEVAARNAAWVVNRYAPLNLLIDNLLKVGEKNRGVALDLNRADDPRIMARLMNNTANRANVSITSGVRGYRSLDATSRGLQDVLLRAQGQPLDATPRGFDEQRHKDFGAYLVARRALSEYERYEAGELERPPIDATKGEVTQAIKDFEAKYKDAFTEAAQWAHEYGMALWQLQYDAGLMTRETYEEGRLRTFYVPLQRDVSDKKLALGASAITAGDRLLPMGKRFRGSNRQIIDPMAVLMEKTFALEKAIAMNEAKRSIAKLADRAGGAGALVERVPASQLMGTQYSVRQVASKLLDNDDISEIEAADMMALIMASYDKEDAITLFRSEQAMGLGQNALYFWEDGKVQAILVQDGDVGRDVVDTMNVVGRENMDLVMTALATTSGVFREAIRLWPDFLVMNFLRDQPAAWVLTEGYIPVIDAARGMFDEITQKQIAKDYNSSRGTLGGMSNAALHVSRVNRDIKTLMAKGYAAKAFGDVQHGWDIAGALRGLSRFTELTETGTRFGVYRHAYKRAIKEGLAPYEAGTEAAYLATDLMDFGLNGSKMMASRRLIPFLNAQLQGLYKLYRTLGADEVSRRRGLTFVLGAYFKDINKLPISRVEKQSIRTGRKAWLKMLSLGVISAALHFLFEDDPDYQDTSEYLRATGWVLPTGKPGEIIYVPKPFEIAVFANAVERFLEFSGGDPEALNRFMRGLMLTAAPPTEVPLIELSYGLATNTDVFSGAPIVPDHMAGFAPYLQFDSRTTNTAKFLAGVTGQSPMVVEHILGSLFAGAYRDVSRTIDAMDPNKPAMQIDDAPLLRRVVRDARRGSTSSQDFYKQAGERQSVLSRAYSAYKQELDAGNELAANENLSRMKDDEKAYALLMTHYTAEEKRLHPFYRTSQVVKVINKMRREISSGLGLGDTTNPDDAFSITLSAKQKAEVDGMLSEIVRRETRNALITMRQPGWTDKEPIPMQETLDLLAACSTDVFYELERRYAKAKVYSAEGVADAWPEVKDRLLFDREAADLTDLVVIAQSGL